MRKIKVTSVMVAALALVMTLGASAADMGAIIKAQVILGQVTQVVDKYQEVQAMLDSGELSLEVADPIQGSTGKFLLPFDEAGNLTAWADKALNAQAGAAAGGVVGDKAVGALASKVPFGGFLAGGAKNKAKETGAVMAIGGWDFIKESTTLSFDSLDDYSVYMHDRYQGLAGYDQALGAAMAIYPALENSHKGSVDKAYKDAQKRARKLAKN